MPKQKTHKASKKVFKKRPGGTISFKKAGGNHQTNKDNGKLTRQRRNKQILGKADANRIKSVI